MNYQEALDYLYSFLDSERKLPRTPVDFHLPRTYALLHALGDPQHAFRSVVVAGTKGKGSTSVMIESIVRTAGYRTGLWTSPHLHSYRERIQIDRTLISQQAFVELVEGCRPAFDAFDTVSYGAPTTFDIGFALALRHFANAGVDLAVLEVGLGGRYDSANAVTPLVSVITSISYDHMETLGNTLAAIAYQKAGILKPQVPGITIPQPPEALDTIKQVADEVGAPLWIAGTNEMIPQLSTEETAVPYPVPGLSAAPVNQSPTPLLPGAFQLENARLATGTALLLRQAGLRISDASIVTGLEQTSWPGRLEIVPGSPTFVLDGAHNGDSATKLVQAVRAAFPDRRIVLLMGTMRGKDLTRILEPLIPLASALVLTASRHPRAMHDLDALVTLARPLLADPEVPIVITEDIVPAVVEARRSAGPQDVVLVTGSLAIVAGAREALGLPNERD